MTDGEHQLAQTEVRERTVGQLVAVLMALGMFRSFQVRRAYAELTAGIVSTGQWQAGRVAIDYMSSLVRFDRPPDLEAAFGDRLMTDTSPGAVVGLVRTWWLEDQGYSAYEARRQGAIFTSSLAEGDLQAAQRIGLDEAASVTRRAVRWRKLANPSACEWCQTIAGEARYRHAYSVPFHRACRCSVAASVQGVQE